MHGGQLSPTAQAREKNPRGDELSRLAAQVPPWQTSPLAVGDTSSLNESTHAGVPGENKALFLLLDERE